MASYLTNLPLWRDLIPLPLFAALASFLLVLVIQEKKNRTEAFILIFSISLLGIVTGQLTGQSRVPAVGAVVPASLSFVGGITIYLIAGKSLKQQLLVAMLISGFSFNFLVGTFWGMRLRYDFEDHRKSEAYRLHHVMVDHNVAMQRLLYELQIKEFREAYNLPERKCIDRGKNKP